MLYFYYIASEDYYWSNLFCPYLKQNPLPYFARYPGADVLTSTDQVIPTVVDDRLDIWQQGEVCSKTRFTVYVCLFFVYFRDHDNLIYLYAIMSFLYHI